MRSTTVVGVALIVLVIAALVALSFRGRSSDDLEEEVSFEESLPPMENNGQFFQEIPSDEYVEESPTPEISVAAQAQQVTVMMSEEGFLPSQLTVSSGTTVHFVNNGQAAHWPASDVHPTHDILPEFDAKRSLATGETYSYTFSKAGVWRCHDHLMPQLTCAITVASDQ